MQKTDVKTFAKTPLTKHSASATIQLHIGTFKPIRHYFPHMKTKQGGGVTGDYMRLMEDEEYLLECGIRQGRQEGIRQSIINALESRFPISDEIKETIYAQTDLNVLDEWLLVAVESTTPEDFAARIH